MPMTIGAVPMTIRGCGCPPPPPTDVSSAGDSSTNRSFLRSFMTPPVRRVCAVMSPIVECFCDHAWHCSLSSNPGVTCELPDGGYVCN